MSGVRFLLLSCALPALACSGDGAKDDLGPQPDGGAVGDAATPPPNCDPVTVAFAGEVATVSGTPLGLDSSVRTSPVSGSFSYRPCILDSRPESPDRGEYDHAVGAGAFDLGVASLAITGSGSPVVKVENLDPDTFRYLDGPQLLDEDKTLRRMFVDGKPNDQLKVSFSITDSTGQAFSSDALPKVFPLTDTSKPHTFSVKDDNGTLLLQLSSLTQK